MKPVNRRGFLGASMLAASVSGAEAQEQAPATSPPEDVTRALARWVLESRFETIPAEVRKEAVRTLFNWVGCAIGGSRQAAVSNTISAFAPFSGPALAAIL